MATIRNSLRPQHLASLGILGSVALTGCLEREETITVRGDGSAHVVHVVRGDPHDLDGGPARYPQFGPFQTRRVDGTDRGGNPEVVVHSEAAFARVADLPTHFGVLGDEFLDEALHFSTELTQQVLGGERRFRFERVYRSRDWSDYRVFYREAFDPIDEHIRNADNIWQQPLEERIRVVRALCEYERKLLQLWAEQAVRASLSNDESELAGLQVRARIDAYFEREVDYRGMADGLTRRLGELDVMCAKIAQDIEALILDESRTRLGLDHAGIERIRRHLDLARHGFKVSQDLEDESFTVRLKLPGKILGHNGTAVVDGFIVWKFGGRDLRDRDHRLVAISSVATR